ncbi:hypothetical protein H6P81_020214 [Aristolochia fimbriata]|uniref:W2 domain-containing protein n=1 Tax=Aristolochia fimbriata TaxID=158543 RepID=A0AAV7DVQ7_ARIFI|nr:hypothetical protein H6P81_020214 [Aristolochia fimbriata]
MALQNIGSANKDDAFYRYKMPRMITKIEGRGNGIKTNVVNMVDIAKALARPASYTTKYFGCELGAQSKFDEKTGTSLVNGAHDTAKLAGLLENFIKKYVQCYGCGNPETEILITKTQMITLKCAACGFVSDVDMKDKLTNFIIKNPPEQKKGGKDKKALRRAEKERLKEGAAADEEQKKLKKEEKKKGVPSKEGKDLKVAKKKSLQGSDEDQLSPTGSCRDENEASDDDDVQWQTDTSKEAAQKRIQEQLNNVTAEMVMLSTDEPEEEKKSKPVKKTPKMENGEPQKSTHESLVLDIKENLKKGFSPMQLFSFFEPLSQSQQQVINASFEALFDGVEKGFAKDVDKKKQYLVVLMQEDGSQMALLQAIESFCRQASADAVKEIGLVLKTLYDADVLEEEYILKWYGDGVAGSDKNSQLWKNVKPFVEWLQSAESEKSPRWLPSSLSSAAASLVEEETKKRFLHRGGRKGSGRLRGDGDVVLRKSFSSHSHHRRRLRRRQALRRQRRKNRVPRSNDPHAGFQELNGGDDNGEADLGGRRLERLLSCFLSLNSPSHHHHAILGVFQEICQALFTTWS